MSCYLSMHSCSSCSPREALVPGTLTSEDLLGSSDPVSPQLMNGQVMSPSLQPPVLFCVEHNCYSRCF